MCGIAGIHAYHPTAPPVDRAELCAIRDHMAVRGPDGFGEWFSADGRAGLAHRRLSIIDLSDRAAQPMASADGQLLVSFNGEIYNYRVLKAELEAKGHVFRTTSDTEVLLHLYAEKGPAMLPHLRGMFAFALWDARKQGMLLARDPYGIKPLYYADDGRTLRLASQVKALLTSQQVSRQPDQAGLAGFYLFGSVPDPYTLYQQIRSVPAGSSLWVDAQGAQAPQAYFSLAQVWQQAEASPLKPGQDPQAFVREALLDSVRHHLVADVPVGAFLSAGIDSGALVGLMKDAGQQDIQTVTLGFDEFWGTQQDEVPLATRVARHYGVAHTNRVVSEGEFQADLPRILAAMDQPSIDGINTWFVSKAAAEIGLKVAVSGLGGDELFGGYPSFTDVPRWARLLRGPARIPGLGAFAEQLVASFPALRHLYPKAAGLLRYGGSHAGAYLLRRGLFLPHELPELMGADAAREGLARLRPLEHIAATLALPSLPLEGEEGPRTPYARVSTLESALYMRNQLLRDTDWASMAHSIEVRTPLVDAVLLRRLARPLLAGELTNRKPLLAGSPSTALPSEVTQRAKSGFTTPIPGWQQRADQTQAWRSARLLAHSECPWARRWSYAVMHRTVDTAAKGLRILLLTTDAYGGHGGIALYNRDIADALAAMPEVAEVVVIPRTLPFPPTGVPGKVRFVAGAAGSKSRFVRRALAAACQQPFDLVLCGHVNLLPLATLLNVKLRAPLALMVYGIDVWKQPGALIRRSLRKVDAVWSISAITRDKMNRWAGRPPSRYLLLPNAIHLEHYGMAAKRADLLDRYQLHGRRVIMTLARLLSAERYKGVDEVLEVMPSLLEREPQLVYLVVGEGNDRPRLEAKAAELGLAGKVVFTGMVQEAEKADHFRLADAFVMPGRGEGFGFVFLEALACGVPAVGSQLDGSREALRGGELGELVDPTNVESLRQGILNALATPKAIPAGLAYFDRSHFRRRLAAAVDKLTHQQRVSAKASKARKGDAAVVVESRFL